MYGKKSISDDLQNKFSTNITAAGHVFSRELSDSDFTKRRDKEDSMFNGSDSGL